MKVVVMAKVNHNKNNELVAEMPFFTSWISTYVARRNVTTRTTGATILEMGLILSSHTISMMNCSKLIAIKAKFKTNRAPMMGVHGTCPCFV